MSSTQKKPDNTKRAASGKASGKPAKRATAKSSSAKKGTSARKKPAAYTPDLVSRGIAAAVCVFLALLVALGMFGIHAVVPDLLKKGIQGLIGYGFWMVAFVLLWAADPAPVVPGAAAGGGGCPAAHPALAGRVSH
mgnify:CR=1 FL=1